MRNKKERYCAIICANIALLRYLCYRWAMTKTSIKQWLKAIGKNRDWLAEKCGVTRGGINTWLSTSRPIPKQSGRLIERLMEQYPATGNAPATYPSAAENAITLTVDDATFDAWNRAATAEGKLLRQWCVDVINDALRDDEESIEE